MDGAAQSELTVPETGPKVAATFAACSGVMQRDFACGGEVKQMQASHLTRLYVADDGTSYGASVARSVRTDATASPSDTPGAVSKEMLAAGNWDTRLI